MVLRLGMGIGLTSAAGSGAPPAAFSGLVATNCRLARSTNGNSFCQMRTAHKAVANISALMVVPVTNFTAANAPESGQGNGGTATVEVAIEDASGNVTRITFPSAVQSAGNPNVGLIPAAGLIFSDKVTLTVPIAAGATFYVRQLFNNNNGLFFIPEAITGSSGKAGGTLAAVGGNLVTSTGAIPSENMTGNGLAMPPCMIIGDTTAPAVAILGDSKAYGFGTTGAGDGREGIICRNFPANTYAFLNLAHPGRQASDFAAGATATSALWPYFNRFIIDLGYNDILTNGASAATTSAAMTTLIGLLPAAAKKTITTLTANSTSTNSWATAGAQTTSPNNAKRVTYNALVRAGSITGVNNGYLEIGDCLETARDSGIWVTTGAANAITTDGVHPTDAGDDLVKTNGGITDPILAGLLV
jgi:hypothetical protein